MKLGDLVEVVVTADSDVKEIGVIIGKGPPPLETMWRVMFDQNTTCLYAGAELEVICEAR